MLAEVPGKHCNNIWLLNIGWLMGLEPTTLRTTI